MLKAQQQHLKTARLDKTVSDSLGTVDVPVKQADFTGHLDDRQVWSRIFVARFTVD